MEAIPNNEAGKGFETNEEVAVERGEEGSGNMESGWKIITPAAPDADPETRVTVVKGTQIKSPTLRKLRDWNS